MKTMRILAISSVVFHAPGFTFSLNIILCLLNYEQPSIHSFFPKVVKIEILENEKRQSGKRDAGHIWVNVQGKRDAGHIWVNVQVPIPITSWRWGLQLWDLGCSSFGTLLSGGFSGYSGLLPLFVGYCCRAAKLE